MTILFVDDVIDILEGYEAEVNFHFDDFRVLLATNGQQALELCQREHVDLIFSDAKMPKMSGLDLFEKLQEMNHQAPRFLITGHIGDFSPNRLKACGAARIFDKPVDFDELINFMKIQKEIQLEKGA